MVRWNALLRAGLAVAVGSSLAATAQALTPPTAASVRTEAGAESVAYRLDASDPSRLRRVRFVLRLDDGTHVVVRLHPAGRWFPCRSVSEDAWTCRTNGAALTSAERLEVRSR